MSSALSDRERLLLHELNANADTLKSMARDHESSFGLQVGREYIELNIAVNNLIANLAYLPVEDGKKQDPFFWGGVANGLAGPGAGMYTAMSTAQANAETEAHNAYWRDRNLKNQVERPYAFLAVSEHISSRQATGIRLSYGCSRSAI